MNDSLLCTYGVEVLAGMYACMHACMLLLCSISLLLRVFQIDGWMDELEKQGISRHTLVEI